MHCNTFTQHTSRNMLVLHKVCLRHPHAFSKMKIIPYFCILHSFLQEVPPAEIKAHFYNSKALMGKWLSSQLLEIWNVKHWTSLPSFICQLLLLTAVLQILHSLVVSFFPCSTQIPSMQQYPGYKKNIIINKKCN